MLEPGSQAPDFTLPDQDGDDVSLSDHRGTKVVLYFYPKADTLGNSTTYVRPDLGEDAWSVPCDRAIDAVASARPPHDLATTRI